MHAAKCKSQVILGFLPGPSNIPERPGGRVSGSFLHRMKYMIDTRLRMVV